MSASYEHSSKGKQDIKQTIVGHVAEMLKTYQARIDEADRETLSNHILERLYRIGLVLTAPQ
jgi:tryptophanyl-tRNA synthetase